MAEKQDLCKTNEVVNEGTKPGRKAKVKTLCSHLKLFTMFKNPRALSKEAKLHQMHLNFLTNKDNEVQTLALNCLMTYKFQYLKPYSENFDKLMNDTTFRDELTNFSASSDVLKQEHRESIMPIVTRLLYGKLQRKSGLGVSGKSSLSARRNVIMQFLANCSEVEIKTFMDLILQAFKNDDNWDKEWTVDTSGVVPLRKQSGFLNMLSNVVTRLKKLVVPFLPSLFSTLLRITWTSSYCLLHRKDDIDPSFLGRLKDLRHLGLTKLNEFFEVMTDYNYEQHKDSMFKAVVWPQLGQLIKESVQNVTPLFRLFVTWSKHNRYHPLLCHRNDDEISPISQVFELLKQKSLSNTVEKEIMIVSSNLLTTEELEADGKNAERQETGESLGVEIIRPHVPTILTYLSDKLSLKIKDGNFKVKQKIGHLIPQLQLSVLSKISGFVTDRKQSQMLVHLLFPLLRCIAAEELQLFIITTVKNLLKYVESVEQYLDSMPSLFSIFWARRPRQVLCQVFLHITKVNPDLLEIATLVEKLNSWDAKRLDEPDYDLRLEAFRKISEHLKSNEWNVKQVLPILHNCLHFIMATDDMSLRDASSSCVEKIIHVVTLNKSTMFDDVVIKSLMPAIKHGVRSKKQAARLEFISLLSVLVKTFDYEKFNDLKLLSSNDPEADFYENIRHIQVHRRIRALRLLAKLCDEESLSVPNMFSFFLPIISHAIFDNLSTTKDHNLLSETIITMGAIAKCLPWSKYLHILKNYLNVMRKDRRNQKTIIRLVVAILDSFHFNVTNVTIQEITTVAPKKTEVNKKEDNKKSTGHMTEEEDGEDVREHEEDNESTEAAVNSQITSQRIHDTLVKNILPRIKSFLNKKSKVDSFHKMSRNKEEDEEDIMKIPMVLAMVKLLQHLPKATLHTHLPGMLLKACQALRSQARDVRDVARETLKKICQSLGAEYFPLVLKEMRSVLLRGYQLHVLGYTVHSLLEVVEGDLKAGDMDACVKHLMEVVKEELFGEVAEEKDVSGITGKLMEAKSRKANDSLEIFTKFVSAGCISEIVTPLKEILESTVNHKARRKLEESLRRVSLGLQKNKGLSVEDLLVFVHGIASNTLPLMLKGAKKDSQITESTGGRSVKEDIYMLPAPPVRGGKTPQLNKQTNEHILMEFALQLLHTGLKRQKFSSSDEKHINMLDPFVSILMSSMTSLYVKVVVLTMRCVSFLIKYPLPSMKASVPALAKQLFKILKKYAKAGADKGENFDLVRTSFKTMTVLIRDYKDMNVTTKQLHILLSFVEEDIYNSARQSTALPLLKSILSRKLMVAEIHEVMSKIADLSIRDSDHVTRLQCRQVMLQYLLDYPLGKKLKKHLDFYVSHLSYEEEAGRMSSMEMISSMLKNFPERMLQEYAGYFFIPLIMMLANDESSNCRKMAASTVKSLLTAIDPKERNDLSDMVMSWSKQEKVLLKQVSTQVFGMFVEIEGKSFFEKRVTSVLPIISDVLSGAAEDDEDDEDEEEEQGGSNNNETKRVEINTKDKLIYHSLVCLGKMFLEPELLLNNEQHLSALRLMWENIKDLLLHAHAWIRLAASQLFSLYFGALTPDELVNLSRLSSQHYLAIDLHSKMKELSSLFFTQIKDDQLTTPLAEQATKNLIYITKVVKLIDPYLNIDNTKTNEEEDKAESAVVTFKSLVTKMAQVASYEASHTPKRTVKRTCVFRWIASLCIDLSQEQLEIYLPSLLRPVHREISSNIDNDSDIFKLSEEVLELIRSTVDKDTFAEVYAKLQKKVFEVKESRKRKAAIQAVADPERHALRKQKLNFAKREQRKRKLHEMKPLLKFKKIRSVPE